MSNKARDYLAVSIRYNSNPVGSIREILVGFQLSAQQPINRFSTKPFDKDLNYQKSDLCDTESGSRLDKFREQSSRWLEC